MTMQKKKFFRRPSAPQILGRTNNKEVKTDFWENIVELKKDESLTLVGKLFDKASISSTEFLKRGPSVIVPTKISENPKLMPYEIREIIFDGLKTKKILHYNGFIYTPQGGVDHTPRRIRLNDILEAAKLYAYAPLSKVQLPFQPSIQLHAYDDAEGVASKGTAMWAKVPSRIAGKGKYKIAIDHVAIIDNPMKFVLAYMLKTDHVCEDKRGRPRYPTKKDIDFVSEYRLDEHEIAAYFAIMDYYANPKFRETEGQKEAPKQNLVPMEMTMTGIPTTRMCTAYDNMLHRVLIKKTDESAPITLNEGHLEALLWEGVVKEGYRACFFKFREGKMKDFAWTQYIR